MIEIDTPLVFKGSDDYGDEYMADARRDGLVWVRLTNNSRDNVWHGYTPKQAKKLAKRLKKLARFAEVAE